ncbi:MAG: PIN domain-containing protein [Oscillospiraceae bacterium]|nr:PIN domain-containing protein [Oscillospiraceae bacterium]
MAIYLIDYENVNTDGLNGISRLSAEDTVVIFYSEKADRMTFGLHRRLMESKAVIDCKKVEVGGSNALDFQLSSYLGFLIAQGRQTQFCIVSNDRGYEHVAGFWSRQKIDVRLVAEISSAAKTAPEKPKTVITTVSVPAVAVEKPAAQTAKPAAPATQTAKPAAPTAQTAKPASSDHASAVGEKPRTAAVRTAAVRTVPPALSELVPMEAEAELVEGFIEHYKTKQGLNNALVRKFGNARGGELYQRLKPLISDKKGG